MYIGGIYFFWVLFKLVMNCYRKLRKDELKYLADELGQEYVAGARVLRFASVLHMVQLYT